MTPHDVLIYLVDAVGLSVICGLLLAIHGKIARLATSVEWIIKEIEAHKEQDDSSFRFLFDHIERVRREIAQ